MNVLIIDDSIEVAEALRDFVVSRGDVAYVAHDGVEGYQRALDVQPDVVISDINMPRMNGYGVAQALRQRFPSMRLIALTASHDSGRAFNAGFHVFLQKPCSLTAVGIALDAGAPVKAPHG